MPEKEEIQIIYAGMQTDGFKEFWHVYHIVGEDAHATFNRKLQKHHEVGMIYPAKREGGTYTTSHKEFAVGAYENSAQVTHWIKLDREAQERKTAVNDERRIEKAVKGDLRNIRRYYQRATRAGKNRILNYIVKELEAKR